MYITSVYDQTITPDFTGKKENTFVISDLSWYPHSIN